MRISFGFYLSLVFLIAVTTICVEADSLVCSSIPASLLNCTFNCSCRYGVNVATSCTITTNSSLLTYQQQQCIGENFTQILACLYCYQLPTQNYDCSTNSSCSSTKRDLYIATCTVHEDTLCLGSRTFQKLVQCNFTTGHSWTITFLLSIFLGGFGADRFYLGYAGWGVFKLLSLGGLGVWTFIDVILVGIGYLTPADGSLYIDL